MLFCGPDSFRMRKKVTVNTKAYEGITNCYTELGDLELAAFTMINIFSFQI